MKKRQSKSRTNALMCFALLTLSSISLPANSQIQTSLPYIDANVEDIIVQASGNEVIFLVKLNEQPSAAATRLTEKGLELSLLGLKLSDQVIDPPTKPYVLETIIWPNPKEAASHINISILNISSVQTKIFKNSVMITGHSTKPLPNSFPGSRVTIPEQIAFETPAFIPKAAALFSDQFNLTPALCTTAARIIDQDPWNLEKMADHALCLVAQHKTDEAKNVIEQLESFSPHNWKSALARAEILHLNGDNSLSSINYSYAMQYAEKEEDRQTLNAWISTRQ